MDAVIGAAERQVVRAARVEFDAAHVGFGFERGDRVLDVQGVELDAGVVRAGGYQARVDLVEVDAPAALLVLLEGFGALARRRVPYRDGAFVVA